VKAWNNRSYDTGKRSIVCDDDTVLDAEAAVMHDDFVTTVESRRRSIGFFGPEVNAEQVVDVDSIVNAQRLIEGEDDFLEAFQRAFGAPVDRDVESHGLQGVAEGEANDYPVGRFSEGDGTVRYRGRAEVSSIGVYLDEFAFQVVQAGHS